MEDFEKASFLNQGGCNVVQFGNADSGGFAHVRIFVAEGSGEWFAEVFGDTIDADAAHGPDGEGSDEGIGVIGILGESRERKKRRTQGLEG